MTEKLKTYNAEDFFYMPIEPSKGEMIIEDLLPKGLTVLAGAPKSCKSWMALDMALAVSAGRSFLGKETKECDVVYLALEDTDKRLHDRLTALEETNNRLHLATQCRSLDDGFLSQINDFIDEYPDVCLIIVDTLQKIRGKDAVSSNSNQYGREYAELSKLKGFADRKGIAILVVHHLRKLQDKTDPLNDIMGSTAMSGVADSILILKKERTRANGELLSVGRDSAQWKMKIIFENYRWHVVEIETEEEIAKKEIPEILFWIRDMILEEGHWEGTATQLLDDIREANMNPNTLSAKISNNYYDVFYPAGIRMETKRTARERLMIFTLMNDEDETELNDSAEVLEETVIKSDDCGSESETEDSDKLTSEENHMMAQEAMNRLRGIVRRNVLPS